MGVIGKTFSKSCLHPPYERSIGRLLSQSTLFMVFYQQKANKNETFEQLALGSDEVYLKVFSESSYFKPLYESSNNQLLLQSNLFIFYQQQKVNENETVKQVPVSANGINQSNFLEGAVLNCSTKGAMTASFCTAHFL